MWEAFPEESRENIHTHTRTAEAASYSCQIFLSSPQSSFVRQTTNTADRQPIQTRRPTSDLNTLTLGYLVTLRAFGVYNMTAKENKISGPRVVRVSIVRLK